MSPDLALAVEPPPVAVLGAPILVAVTVANPRPERTYYALPPIEWFAVPPPVELVLTPPGAGAEPVALPVRLVDLHEGPPRGMTLRPGQSHRALVDLSELLPPLYAGRWRLGARYHAPPLPAVEAAEAELEVVEPSAASAKALAGLRRRHEGREPSWNAVLLHNTRTIEDEELADLDPDSRAAIGLHLWLHRAVYGPTPTAALDPTALASLGVGPLEGEAAVLSHELRVARGDPGAAALAAAIVARWPGLQWRLEEGEAGQGLVQTLRRVVGAERPSAPAPLPYST
jgi:hypothetical protein